MKERGELKCMCPVIPSEYPHVFNMLAKAIMFKGYKVSAIFMVKVFCLLELQFRNMCLVGLASQEENYFPHAILCWGTCASKKNLFGKRS